MQSRLCFMEKALEQKVTRLRERIRRLDGAVVAFSGGVDSAFLMRICRDELGDKAVAVTSLSKGYPRSELTMAKRVARILGVKHLVIKQQRAEQEAPDACQGIRAHAIHGYNLYSQLKSVAMRMKLGKVVDGSHRDDKLDGNQSFMAAKRAGIRSPLLESDLTKAEIRLLAGELGLPNWNGASSSEKRKKKPKAADMAAVKAYLARIAPTAPLSFRGGRVMLELDRKGALLLLPRLGRLQKKVRSLGLSEVVLKVCDKKGVCKTVRKTKKSVMKGRL